MIFSTIINNLRPRFFSQPKVNKLLITYEEAKKAKEKLVDSLFKNHNVVSVGVYEQQDFKGSHCVKVGLKNDPTDVIPAEFVIKSDNGSKVIPIFTEVVGEIKAQ